LRSRFLDKGVKSDTFDQPALEQHIGHNYNGAPDARLRDKRCRLGDKVVDVLASVPPYSQSTLNIAIVVRQLQLSSRKSMDK
jgi:hypothetical protein